MRVIRAEQFHGIMSSGSCFQCVPIRAIRVSESHFRVVRRRRELRRESAEAKAARLLSEELARLGWTQEQLEVRRRNDPSKLCIAARLRKETTLSIKAIAALVHLGASKGANTNLHKWMQGPPPDNSVQHQLGI